MVARLRLLCLGLGLLSTVVGCAVAPPPMAPLRATLPSDAPSAVAPPALLPPDIPPVVTPPVVTPLPYPHPPSATDHREPATYQTSPYEQKIDEEELEYRRRRSAQEQAQEQRYRQWELERERERDPRWER